MRQGSLAFDPWYWPFPSNTQTTTRLLCVHAGTSPFGLDFSNFRGAAKGAVDLFELAVALAPGWNCPNVEVIVDVKRNEFEKWWGATDTEYVGLYQQFEAAVEQSSYY